MLSACGGHGGGPIPAPVQDNSNLVGVSFNIVIPQAIAPKYISPSTQSASIAVNSGAPTIVNCTAMCSATVLAPIGSDTFAVKLYDAQNATGNLLSEGTMTATIVAGIANSVSVTFAGVVKTITLSSSSPNVTRGIASTVPVTITAKDPDNNTIVGTYDSPISLSNSDTSGATTLNVTTVSSSSSGVTVSYNGSNSFSGATITASASGATSGTLNISNPCGRIPAVQRGYYPCDLQFAYNLPTRTAGSGQTVAIVDAFDDPNAESDLAVYRSTFGLPSCTTANGCFRKVSQTGGVIYPVPDTGWAEEMSLDLDMVSAICPLCHILLVESTDNDAGIAANMEIAENEAAVLGANEISNSWGSGEFSNQGVYYTAYFNHPGVMITVSSGDAAYAGGTQYPASSRFVTAVGGTSLVSDTSSRGWSETAWYSPNHLPSPTGAGSGCSSYETKPAWQTDPGCPKRMVADVSAVADPATGVAVYDTYNEPGWLRFGGTSASAPIIAAVYALAGNGSSLTYGSYPYSHTSGLYDVVSGSTGTCSPSYFCTAGPGYDGPTGLGTPNGTSGLVAFSQTMSVGMKTGVTDTSRIVYEKSPTRNVCRPVPPPQMRCYAIEALP